MRHEVLQHQILTSTWLRFLLVVVLLLGVLFRFYNLDQKVYWSDETYTSLRISGYTKAEFTKQVFNGHVIDVKDLQKYQGLNTEKGLTDTVNSLVLEDIQHPPLYYVLTRLVVQWFGNSVAVIRSVSALISLLVFPCIYWLSRELFNSSLVAWMAIAIIAVSPFHVLYAQEAREYSLWTVIILLSSASLLQAMRLKTKFSWVTYAATLVLGFYSFLFSVLIVVSHGLYVFATENFRLSRTVKVYLLASLVAFITYIPWLIHFHKLGGLDWINGDIGLLVVVRRWVGNISLLFIDFNIGAKDSLIYAFLTASIVLALVAYSIYFLLCTTPRRVWLFILLLIGVTAMVLILPDLIWGGQRSTVPRYVIPCFVGIQLSVAYLLATQIVSSNLLIRKVWQVIVAMLILSGIMSCIVSSQGETWWNKTISNYAVQTAHVINKTSHPLVVSTIDNADEILVLSHLLDARVKLQLMNKSNIAEIAIGFKNVFLFNPSQGFRNEFQTKSGYRVEPIYPNELKLYKLTKLSEHG